MEAQLILVLLPEIKISYFWQCNLGRGGRRGAGYHVVQASLEVDEDDLRLLIFLLPPSKSWDSMCAPGPVSGVLELKLGAS